ncbi:MAG: hypothetical protein P1P65_01190 [Treponema sp.]
MMKRYTPLCVPAVLFFGLLILTACSPIIVKTDKNYIKDRYDFLPNESLPEMHVEPFPVANVDYEHKNQMVFVNFSDSKGKLAIKEISNTVWDIAIVAGDEPDSDGNGSIYMVTNSGDYGENTFILPFADGRTMESYRGSNISIVRQVCFKKGETDLSPYQNDPDSGSTPVANPFYEALKNGKKYFLRVGKNFDDAELFVIWFDVMSSVAAGQTYTLHVKPVTLTEINGSKNITGFGTEYTLTKRIDNDYSFNYIKLLKTSARVLNTDDGIPKKNEWQLLFIRTHIYSKEMGEVFGNDGIIGSSSILTNSPGGVQTAALYGWDFPEVTNVPADKHFKRIIDGVGKGFANLLNDDPEKRRKAWYYGLNMPPTYYLNRNTYVFKWETAEGVKKYAKFRPGSFYGPGREKFYVQFRYAVK